MERGKVWLSCVSFPFSGTVDTTANTAIISVPNCKQDGRKLNHSSSTLTPKRETIAWQCVIAITSVKWNRVVTERSWGNCQVWFNLSHMIINTTIFWKKWKIQLHHQKAISLLSPEKCTNSEREWCHLYMQNTHETRISLQMWLSATSQWFHSLYSSGCGEATSPHNMFTNNVEVAKSWNHFWGRHAQEQFSLREVKSWLCIVMVQWLPQGVT